MYQISFKITIIDSVVIYNVFTIDGKTKIGKSSKTMIL